MLLSKFVGAILLCIAASVLTFSNLAAQSNSVTIGVGDTVLAITGKTSPDAFVTISEAGNVLGTTTANSAGEFNQTLTAQSPGLHELSFYARTTSGNDTDIITSTIHITEHATTTLQVFLPSTLHLETSNLFYGQALQLRGETAPASTVTIYIDNAIYASTATDNNSGNWNLDIDTLPLTAGSHQVFARVTDALGSQSYPTSSRTFFVAPKPSSITPILPSFPQSRTGLPTPIITFPKTDTIWQQPAITIKGSAGPNLAIELWDENRVIGSVWSDMQGQWSLDLTLQPGDYALRARACLQQQCSNFSPTVRFTYAPELPLSPAGRPLRIMAEQYAFWTYTGEPITIKASVLDGQPPYKTTMQWAPQEAEKNTHVHNRLDFTHRYTKPGRYTVTLDVIDAQGRAGQALFSVLVQQREAFALWPLLLMLLLIGLLLALFLRRQHAKASERDKKTRNNRGNIKLS